MKFCLPHWDELKEAIKKRGLFHLVAKDGQAAVERMKEEMAGTQGDDNYDPLMTAHWMITGKALEMAGLYLLHGDLCPLCELNSHAKKGAFPDGVVPSTEWINGCCDAVLKYCQERHLVTASLPPDRP